MDLTAVKMILAGVMLCTGFVHFTFANHLRIFNNTQRQEKTWNESKNACEEHDEFLVTLYDEADTDFINMFTKNVSTNNGIYVGLRWSNQTSRWSDDAPYLFNLSTVNVADGALVCEGIDKDKWTGFNCSDRMYFMCYQGNNYHLIEKEKTWCQAQLHCRKHYTDLVHITDDEQNIKVIQKGQNKTFWIGLRHDDWEWVDKGCSTYRPKLQKTKSQECTILTPKLEPRECGEPDSPEPVVCSKGRVRIVVVNESKTWEEAFDYCEENYSSLLQIEDDEDQMAVNQWLGNSNSSADLFWIALRQSRVFGFWIWRDRTVSNNNWKDNKIPEMPLSNNCGVINRTDFKWQDENCWHKLPFLCEEEISFSK